MENINMEMLYKILINDLELNDKNLMVYGYSSEEIYLLLEQGIIERKNNGEYKLLLVDKFRQYGVKLLKAGRRWEANKCFKKCYELAPNGKNICLQYLLAMIKKKNFKEVFKIIDSLDKIQPEKNIVNNNLYLYLLSFLTECPKEYSDRIRDLEFDDFMLPMYRGNKTENEIRGSIIRGKFKLAYQNVNTLLLKLVDYSPKFELMRELLGQVIWAEKTYKANLLRLAKEDKYEEIICILKKRQSIRYLGNLEMYVLMIAEAIVKIMKTGVVTVPTVGYTDDMYHALIGNNYVLALEINDKFNSRFNEDKSKDIVNVLLVKLNDLILEIKSDYSTENTLGMNTSLSKEKIDNKEISYLQYSNNGSLSELDKDILEAEELAYYMASENISIEDAKSSFGVRNDNLLLIKLVYARDYYIEGKYLEGDILLREVELVPNKSGKVLCFLDKVKEYRDVYKLSKVNIKKLVP